MTAHEDWVTSRTKAWLDEQYSEFIEATIAEAKQENADAGNTPGDSLDDDTEWLAGELSDLAHRKLVHGQGGGIVDDFVADCLSETDWTDIALGYLTGE